jgi:ATP-dependent Clp protease ATP-binding subunit ClpB
MLGAGEGEILDDKSLEQGVSAALKAAFRPEFLNRIDEIITFHALTKENISDIAAIQIAGLNQRLEQRNLRVELDGAAMGGLADKGYDPSFGARPLKRVIQQEIENPLSMAILKGELIEGTVARFTLDSTGKGLVLLN